MRQFSGITIFGLFGDRTIRIRMEGRVLVIVGHNGTGKSTAISILFFCLTQQWSRLATFIFNRIEIDFDGQVFGFDNGDISALALLHDAKLPSRIYDSLALDNERLEEFQFRRYLVNNRDATLSSNKRAFAEFQKRTRELKLFENFIKDESQMSVLYLPTYRRIEKELQEIFRGNERSAKDAERIISRIASLTDRHVELVSFGMEDVKQLIAAEVEDVRRIANARLSDLSGSYLLDILENKVEAFDGAIIERISEKEIDNVLKIVDDDSLPPHAKKTVKETITNLHNGKQSNYRDRLLANYFTKLYNTYEQIRQRERSINFFTYVCNEYFYAGKEFIYDEATHDVVLAGNGSDPLHLSQLSSGEKQIVSIFAHILLSQREAFFVIIDEPEMSLSVKWQERFLPDLLATGRVESLVAVTHSPFIFRNNLESNTRDFGNFTTYE